MAFSWKGLWQNTKGLTNDLYRSGRVNAKLGLRNESLRFRTLGALGYAATRPGVTGAAIGGLYGAMSDDTSVLGGAAVGAGIGRYGMSAYRMGRRGWTGAAPGHNRFITALSAGGKGAFNHAYRDAVRSGSYIRNNYTRPYNAIRGLFR